MSATGINWFKYSSPQAFYPLAGRMIPWFTAAAVGSIAIGLYVGFFVAPTDVTQGDAYRIIFVHVPAAWMSMFLYVIMAMWAGLGLGLNARPSFMMAQAIAPTGAMFTFLALFTGSMWGKPTWGVWWTWDARLTLTAILLLIFAGYLMLRSLTEDENRAASAAAVLGIIGFLDIPLIHMSVYWWRTLHQPPSILRPDKAPWDNVHPALLTALAINFVGFMLLYFYLLSQRFRLGEINEAIKARLLNRDN